MYSLRGYFFHFIFYYPLQKNTKICHSKGNARNNPFELCYFFVRDLRTNYPQPRFWIVFWLRPTRDFTVNNDLQAAEYYVYVYYDVYIKEWTYRVRDEGAAHANAPLKVCHGLYIYQFKVYNIIMYTFLNIVGVLNIIICS